jgi:hypothetical protein
MEAVVNSIQAIEEAGESAGRIDIHIKRETAQGLLKPEEIVGQPVVSFVVQDNGVGFTDENYKSFSTSDSAHKAERGGKGIGRFLWLKAFDCAEVESVYNDADWDRGSLTTPALPHHRTCGSASGGSAS